MIRLLLLAVGGWLAWRNRSRIQRLASRLPELEKRTAKAVGEVTDKVTEGLQDIKEGLDAPEKERRSAAGRK
jgi:hypothetical protein